MTKRSAVVVALVMLAGASPGGQGQDVRALLQAASANMGADNLRTLQYTASGMVAAPGQGFDPIPARIGVPESWPRFAVTNYTMTIDYTTMSSREEYTRTAPGARERLPRPGSRRRAARQPVRSGVHQGRRVHRRSGAAPHQPGA